MVAQGMIKVHVSETVSVLGMGVLSRSATFTGISSCSGSPQPAPGLMGVALTNGGVTFIAPPTIGRVTFGASPAIGRVAFNVPPMIGGGRVEGTALGKIVSRSTG